MKTFKHVALEQPIEQLERITTEEERVYVTESGEKYPSVTTVLSHLSAAHIAKWRRRVGTEQANKVSAMASRRGTKVHAMCEDYVNNEGHSSKTVPLDHFLFGQIKPVLDERVDNIHGVELPLYSHYLRVAGTCDCIAEFDGRLSIIDFKTASKPKKSEWITNYFMQEAAYAVMFEERTGKGIQQLVTIVATEEGDGQVFVEHRDKWIGKFMDARETYDNIRGR